MTPGTAATAAAIPVATTAMTPTMPAVRPVMKARLRRKPNAAPAAARLSVFGPGLPVRAKFATMKLSRFSIFASRSRIRS